MIKNNNFYQNGRHIQNEVPFKFNSARENNSHESLQHII